MAIATALLALRAVAQSPVDVQAVLARVGERVEAYYKRVQNIVCLEKATVQPIGPSFSIAGFARVTESELHIEPTAPGNGEPATGATVVRRLLKINGRVAQEKDKKESARCTDPNPLSNEPLEFLLGVNRPNYKFSFAGFGKGKDRDALIIEFITVSRGGDGTLTEDPDGRRDCFEWTLPVGLKGRVWIEAATYDVLRVESRLAGLGQIRVSFALQLKHGLQDWIVIDRFDQTIRYKMVAFKDPDDTMLLPESIETLLVIRSDLQSMRKREEYSGYRRFLTGGRIVKDQ